MESTLRRILRTAHGDPAASTASSRHTSSDPQTAQSDVYKSLRTNRARRLSAVTAVCASIVVWASTIEAAQSLADAAKKAEEQHAKSAVAADSKKPPTRAYTNKDLTPVEPVATKTEPAATAQTTAASTATAPATAATAADEAKPVLKDEAYWHARMRSLRTKRDDDTQLLAAARAREKDLERRLNIPRDSNAFIADRKLRAQLDDQKHEAGIDVDRLTVAFDSDTRAVALAEEEAHRDGVPPGWLRYP